MLAHMSLHMSKHSRVGDSKRQVLRAQSQLVKVVNFEEKNYLVMTPNYIVTTYLSISKKIDPNYLGPKAQGDGAEGEAAAGGDGGDAEPMFAGGPTPDVAEPCQSCQSCQSERRR